jgi:hypothetical protein
MCHMEAGFQAKFVFGPSENRVPIGRSDQCQVKFRVNPSTGSVCMVPNVPFARSAPDRRRAIEIGHFDFNQMTSQKAPACSTPQNGFAVIEAEVIFQINAVTRTTQTTVNSNFRVDTREKSAGPEVPGIIERGCPGLAIAESDSATAVLAMAVRKTSNIDFAKIFMSPQL